MCEMTKKLKEIADHLVKKTHQEIAQSMTRQDEIDFYNSVQTLSKHSEYIAKKAA